MLWESIREPTRESERHNDFMHNKGLHSIGNSIATEAKLATLTRRLEALETTGYPSQVSMCTNFNSSNQGPHYSLDFQQVNAMFQPTPRNDSFFHTYNPGWKNILISHRIKAKIIILNLLRIKILRFKNTTLQAPILLKTLFLIKHPSNHPVFMIRIRDLILWKRVSMRF